MKTDGRAPPTGTTERGRIRRTQILTRTNREETKLSSGAADLQHSKYLILLFEQTTMTKTNSLIDEAFALLGEANEMEKSAESSTSLYFKRLEDCSRKYNEACYLMKRHLKSNSGGSSDGSSAKMKQLLVEKIDHYEIHAEDLIKKAKDLKSKHTDQQVDCSDSARERSNLDHGGAEVNKNFKSTTSNSSWEASHSSHMHYQSTVKGNGDRNPSKHSLNKKDEMEEITLSEGKATRCLDVAIDHDERGETIEALQLYLQAIEYYSVAIQSLSFLNKGGNGVTTSSGEQSSESSSGMNSQLTTHNKERVASLERKRKLTINRVNELKNRIQGISNTTDTSTPDASPTPTAVAATTIINNVSNQDSNVVVDDPSDKLTPYEIKVLSWSSHIASGVFLPWYDEEARTYDYTPQKPWTDPEGLLPLSPKQEARFHKWARPSDIVSMRQSYLQNSCKISMVSSITPYTIKQYCVSDCSFIAGLCICAAYERRFNRKLVSSLIYPQHAGMPIYNPKGVYMVKLWLNGVERRVLVDDMLPVDESGNLLCSYTKTKEGGLELWVPILEKAYMKLCGGYDFPGSNSGVDLFSLTGWIPERIFFPVDPNNIQDFETPVERAWERLYSANSYGDCLITVSTSKEMTEEDAERVGLFTSHAYAVLGVVQTSNGTRLLQLKNPWASSGWKGKFSPIDKDSWSDQFCREVGYDAASAAHYDDGVFWMSWEHVLLFFGNMHLSWSTAPELFRYRTRQHGYWDAKTGPRIDSYNVGENPQYTITLSEKAIQNKATLWLLLSRHVTKQEQEGADVTDFLTLHIHRINNAKQRVFYPDQQQVLQGAYTNNQHVLVRYDITGHTDKYLSVVLSQFKKVNSLGYTLSCFCTETFALGHPEQPLCQCCQLKGSWKLRGGCSDQTRYSLAIGSAGGPPGKGSFGSNPQWSVQVTEPGSRIQLKCMTAKEFSVNVILARSKPSSSGNISSDHEQRSRRIHHIYEDPIIDTGDYRHGFAVSPQVFVKPGWYSVIASTFVVGDQASFHLHLLSSANVHVKEIV